MISKNSGLLLDKLAIQFGGVHVFEDVTVHIPPGRVTACIGPNGAGKTTLINIVCGVLSAQQGRVLLDGVPLAGMRPHKIARRGIGRTFQDVRIFPTLSAIENVLVAVPGQQGEKLHHLFRPGRQVSVEERRHRAEVMALLDAVALADLADRPAGELPFGRQKLLALARAVATGAGILLLDEPTSGVEMELIPRITALIRRLVNEEHRAVLLVEHNVDVVREVADQVVVLQGGGVIVSGACERVLSDERVIKEYLGRVYDA
jgi:branched-chain amino acid transport system ATP-binding protein